MLSRFVLLDAPIYEKSLSTELLGEHLRNVCQALDARTGSLLWKASLGAQIVSGPITYEVDGKQYVTAISGLSLCVFGLRE